MLKHASLGLLFFRNGLTARIVCISTSSSVRVVIRVVSGLLVVSVVILLLGLIVVVIVVGIEFLLIHVLLLRLLLLLRGILAVRRVLAMLILVGHDESRETKRTK